jgi:hypothetical protein
VPQHPISVRIKIFDHIRRREAETALLPPGAVKHAALIEIAKLRADAATKQWLDSGAPKSLEDGPA